MGHCKKYLIGILILLLLDLSPFVLAQKQREETVSVKREGNSYILTLDEVTQMALINNFDIQLAKYDAQIAATEEGVATSIYDTVINAELNYRKDKSARTNTFGGTASDETNYNIGATKKLPTGTTVSVDFLNNKAETDSAFATINPAYDSSVGVTVKQELGKNFFGIKDRGNIKITIIGLGSQNLRGFNKPIFYLFLMKIKQPFRLFNHAL